MKNIFSLALVAATAAAIPLADSTTDKLAENKLIPKPTSVPDRYRPYRAPLYDAGSATIKHGSYLVAYHDNFDGSAEDSWKAAGLSRAPQHSYGSSFNGFADDLDEDELESVRQNPNVRFVEHENSMVEYNAPYGLAITSEWEQLARQNQTRYYYAKHDQYEHNVTVYLIDTGVREDHIEFSGHALNIVNFVTGEADTDMNGHGTHVAGIIGAWNYGVFKDAQMRAIKALNSKGLGYTSIIIKSLDFARQDCRGFCVINISAGSDYSAALNEAIDRVADANITVVVAAGNSDEEACQTSPASAAKAITVGAIDDLYHRASFSKYGKCVDIFAPGVNIKSLGIATNDSTAVMSGTSMASPHVAGLAAYFIANGATNQNVLDYILGYAQYDLVVDAKDSPNYLANNAFFRYNPAPAS